MTIRIRKTKTCKVKSLMKIKKTKMEKNQYRKVNAEDWMVYPKCSDVLQTSYYA